jgi:hypothetical protein
MSSSLASAGTAANIDGHNKASTLAFQLGPLGQAGAGGIALTTAPISIWPVAWDDRVK